MGGQIDPSAPPLLG